MYPLLEADPNRFCVVWYMASVTSCSRFQPPGHMGSFISISLVILPKLTPTLTGSSGQNPVYPGMKWG
ncbi:hypothetical protein CEXT_215141 [Caerostris extrusa]|uniref:Uncharacterized protein n=1 Tax=Caerostris extrusa TaxID=172846 RepID=A0AAV4NQ03_CAEEX|nr:hypothetical protein CEXT_215141 [Caerostris extrusa]